MKTKDIRSMTVEDREKELAGLRREQFNLRMQKATAQLSNSANLKKVRRDIARLKTIANEKQG
jgi:large subunit ribosomal protein L29